MATKASVSEIEAHFSDFVRTAEGGGTVLVTRHGKPVVAMVPASEVAQLERLRAAGPEKGLISVAGGWEGSEELVEGIAATAARSSLSGMACSDLARGPVHQRGLHR
jgi:prevent-host-death family protein